MRNTRQHPPTPPAAPRTCHDDERVGAAPAHHKLIKHLLGQVDHAAGGGALQLQQRRRLRPGQAGAQGRGGRGSGAARGWGAAAVEEARRGVRYRNVCAEGKQEGTSSPAPARPGTAASVPHLAVEAGPFCGLVRSSCAAQQQQAGDQGPHGCGAGSLLSPSCCRGSCDGRKAGDQGPVCRLWAPKTVSMLALPRSPSCGADMNTNGAWPCGTTPMYRPSSRREPG